MSIYRLLTFFPLSLVAFAQSQVIHPQTEKAPKPIFGEPLLAPNTKNETLLPHSGLITPRTIQTISIDPYDRKSVVDSYVNVFLPLLKEPINWTGGDIKTCTPGKTSVAYAEATIDAVNYFRALVSLPAVKHDANLDKGAQAAALVMAANNDLSHTPPSTWKCMSQLSSIQTAGKSNLSAGHAGPKGIEGYIYDGGDNNLIVGHRRWIFSPSAAAFGTGTVGPVDGGYGLFNALDVLSAGRASRPTSAESEIIAWPPRGYVPVQHLISSYYKTVSRWSFSLNIAPNADYSQASVTVSELTQGNRQVTTKITEKLNVQKVGDTAIVWETPDLALRTGEADRTFLVTVSNIKGAPKSSYSYQVTAIDPNPSYSVTGKLVGMIERPAGGNKYWNWVDIVLTTSSGQYDVRLFHNKGFEVPNAINPNDSYKISLKHFPSEHACVIENATGDDIRTNIDNIVIRCTDPTKTFNVKALPSSNGKLTCSASGAVQAGTPVSCQASPNSGYYVSSWYGACENSKAEKCEFGVGKNAEIGVVFTKKVINKPPYLFFDGFDG